MRNNPPDQALLTRYLLGELAEDECERIERECVENEQTFEYLEAIEAELTDDYVRGDLVGRRRKQFEKRLLNAADLRLAEFMTGCHSRRRPLIAGVQGWLMRPAAAAAALALAVGIGWFSLKPWLSKPVQPQVAKSGPNAAPAREAPTPAVASAPRGKTPLIATFLLTSGGVRGEGEANGIRIPAGAKSVRFRIDLLSNRYQTYEVSLNRVEGERLFVQSHVKAPAGTVLVVVPAKLLPPGSSILTLRGVGEGGSGEVVGKYAIRVEGK